MDTDLETRNPMLEEAEVKRLLSKCDHYGMDVQTETMGEGHLVVVVAGQQIVIFERSVKKWCPNAIVQGAGGRPNAVKLIWEAGCFIKRPTPELTKPGGSLPDKAVLENLTRQQIDTLTMLVGVLKTLNADIEKAYPGVLLGNTGYGKGKRDLVIRVFDLLHERASQNVPQYITYVALTLNRHLMQGDPAEELEIPEPPRAWTRTK